MNIQDQRDFNRGCPPLHKWLDGYTYWHRAYIRYIARKKCVISTIWGPKVMRTIVFPIFDEARITALVSRKLQQMPRNPAVLARLGSNHT